MEILAKDSKGEITDWEEIPDEDLWEDGELETVGVAIKIYSKVCRLGEWKLIREVK
tara:strand:- start:303 stop:470 length:168 start_codon:yes stop_codon:yes gene_type:complete